VLLSNTLQAQTKAKPNSAAIKKVAAATPKAPAVSTTEKPCTTYVAYKLTTAGDTINIVDCKNRKQGRWVEQTIEGDFVEVPKRSVGEYINNKRVGNWYFYEGEVLQSTAQYLDSKRDAEVNFYEEGVLACKGYYRNISTSQTFDTIAVYNPRTGMDTMVAIRSATGLLKNGLWTFYDIGTGKVLYTRLYWLDELIETKEYQQELVLSEEEKQRLEQRMPHNGGRVFAPMQRTARLPSPPTIKQMRRNL
jgi:hypothetical protein